MSLKRLDPCCSHPEHARPFVNEEGHVLTGDPNDSATWESWLPREWSLHCSAYSEPRQKRDAETALQRYHRRNAA